MGNKNNQDISVIMPVYNGIGFLEKSLPPLVAMLNKKEIQELIVIDDGSLDKSAEIAKNFGAKILFSGGRKGPGSARNIAARQAQGGILWFIDADVVVREDAAKILKDGFTDKAVTAVFGSYDDTPAAQNFLSQYKNMIHHYYHQQANKAASTFWAGCGAVRKQDFLAVGGFDIEQFKYPSIEDIELGYRLRAAGGHIHVLAELQSTHLKVWRFINLVHTEFFRRALPWSRLMLRQNMLTNDLNVSVSERFRALLAIAMLLAAIASAFDLLPWWVPCALLFAAGMANFRLINFFYQRKGLLFSFNSLLYQQFYYIYSSTAFLYALLEKILIDNKK
jgi:glycosyltransferase involved in cell wall biosynthesis